MPAAPALELAQKKRNFGFLLLLHLQNFQQITLLNRRRRQQRRRHKLRNLEDQLMKQLLLLNANFMQAYTTLAWLRYGKQRSTDAALQSPPLVNILPELDAVNWLDEFRMNRATFAWLCAQVQPGLSPVDANIAPERRIAIALYTLAHRTSLMRVARRFGVSRRYIFRIVRQFAGALLRRLGGTLLTLPEPGAAQYDEIRAGFARAAALPMPPLIAGVVGLSELRVRDHSLRLETIVDDRLLFRRVRVSAGSSPQNMLLDVLGRVGTLQPLNVAGRTLSCFVLAPAGHDYPLRSCLLQPYGYPTLPHEFDFNEAVSGVQQLAQDALRRLHSRWQFDAAHFKAATVVELATACCALHNILEDRDEQFLEKWSSGLDLPAVARSSASRQRQDSNPLALSAAEMRDFLANTISANAN